MNELKIIERLVDDLVTRVEALEEKADEIWVPVEDNWNYFISNKGRVKHYQGREPKIWFHKSAGYYCVKLNSKDYLLHRLLAIAFIPNPERKSFVDHKDGDPQNNCLDNLRWCTRTENMRNRKKHCNNTSGYKGVSFYKETGKWKAQITGKDGKRKHLGYFHAKAEAAAVYEEAAKKEFGEFFCKR